MKDVGRYLQAGTRENTRRSYQSAIEHFEVTWGGFLPTTSDSIVRYLVDYADSLSLSTLKQRLAALAQWHITQGFLIQPRRPQCVRCSKAFAHCIRHRPNRQPRCSCGTWNKRFSG